MGRIGNTINKSNIRFRDRSAGVRRALDETSTNAATNVELYLNLTKIELKGLVILMLHSVASLFAVF